MTTAGKIRILLALLFASLLITAVIVEKTYTAVNNLTQTARILESNLRKKETLVYNTINNKRVFNEIKQLRNHPEKAIAYIDDYITQKSIWFIVLKKGQLDFWTGVRVIPQNASRIKEGSSFIQQPNGYYEVIKKTDGDASVIFFIPVKANYPFVNPHLHNVFAADLTTDKNLEIADFTDKGIYAVHGINKNYLFSVKLIKSQVNYRFFIFIVSIWLLTILTLCILAHKITAYIAAKSNIYLALLFLSGFIAVIRIINLHCGWPNFTQQLQLFNPSYYASTSLYRSLGDFCINVFAFLWFVAFAYKQRRRFLTSPPGKTRSYVILGCCIAILIIIANSLLSIFYGLVINSRISFDVNNVLNLSGFSLIGIAMLCFSFLTFLLITDIALTICFKLNVPLVTQGLLFGGVIIFITAATAYYKEFSLFYLLWMMIVLIRAYGFLYNDKKFTAATFLSIILVCAIISAVKLNHFESIKENNLRKVLIQRLEAPDDVTADMLFKRIERNIIVDKMLFKYYQGDYNSEYLETHLQKLYFDRYLSKYDIKIHEYNEFDQPVSADKNYSLDVFKDMVVYSSFKVSDYFYRENESFGFQSYFAILPVIDNSKKLGTIVIELKSKPLLTAGNFPELLADNETSEGRGEFKDYSYAFYTDNILIGKSGTYVYSIVNKEFKGELKKYVTQTSNSVRQGFVNRFSTFSHLLYKPSKRNLIVVSKENNAIFSTVTALTFFYVVLLAFSLTVVLIRMFWLKIKVFNVGNKGINWNIKFGFDRILYKTRIQFSMIFAVVATLILVGFITFFSISAQYQAQQDNLIRYKIMQITEAFETVPISSYLGNISEDSRIRFDELAKTYSADLTLYNLNGAVIITTQPKIYEYGLLSGYMNAKAYVALNGLQKSEVVNDEKIGGLLYKAAYMPIRNLKHQTVAYLQLPYFANEADYTKRIGSLLNIMINVYALVFIAIGLLAVIIARQITAPLNFIQYNFSKTIYGKKNEPIKWNRNDEIGALVKEYNKMIAALENSAQKLAQSERETAWREMAKQVAHEIKNPLTPLKLGLQLLDKSWRDKDPKFDQKFERFSKSFVEQIESLSSIASEFSAFAKMPDTRIERIDIFEMLGQAVTIFKQMDNVTIVYQAPTEPFYINADRDQLLRCFNNLLKNAIEATPQEKSCVIEITYLKTSKNILLTIKDNGNGIPEGMREKIFEPNFTTKSSGTGLGLAFVKNSIENASGKVWFETTIGTGTTFYLNLPATEV